MGAFLGNASMLPILKIDIAASNTLSWGPRVESIGQYASSSSHAVQTLCLMLRAGRVAESLARLGARAWNSYARTSLRRTRHKVTGLQGMRAESPLKSTVAASSSAKRPCISRLSPCRHAVSRFTRGDTPFWSSPLYLQAFTR
jgi:hypothetical protein